MHVFLWFFLAFPVCFAQTRSFDPGHLDPQVKNDLFRRFPALQNSDVSISTLDKAVKYLMGLGIFDSVAINKSSRSDGSTVFSLDSKAIKKVAGFKIKGNNAFSEDEILGTIHIKTEDVFDSNTLLEGLTRLQSTYADQGFPDAEIDFDVKDLGASQVQVNLDIREKTPHLIADIIVDSPNRDLNRQTVRLLSKRVGQRFTATAVADIQKQARSFFVKEGYYKSELSKVQKEGSPNAQILKFEISNPYKYYVSFKGNSKVSAPDLKELLDLDNYGGNPQNFVQELTTKINSYYLSEGYARVSVEAQESDGSADFKKDLYFQISEGAQIEIEQIEITGKFSKDSNFYQKIIRDSASPLIKKGFYNRDDLDAVLKNLTIALQNEGFLKAKIISTRTQFNKEKTKVTIVINLDEGAATQVQRISFKGNQAFTEIKLREILLVKSNESLKLDALEKSIQDLKQFYRSRGYLEMHLINEGESLITYNENNTQADLTFDIAEGPQVRVASIVIEGNTITKDRVIRKELEFKEGDTLTPDITEESISRLERVGLFNSVEIKTLQENTQISDRTVLVRVTERDPGLFNFGAGVKNEYDLTVRGYTGLSYRNLGGTARGISGRVETNYNLPYIKYPETEITSGFLEPYLFDTRMRGRVSLARSTKVTEYNLKSDQGNVTLTNQIGFLVEQDWTSHILLSWNLWQFASLQDYPLREDPTIPIVTQNIAKIGPSIEIDYRDNKFISTKGSFFKLGLEYSDPVFGSTETINFYKTSALYKHFTPLHPGWVWANNLGGAYLRNLSTREDGGVPYDKEGFTLGGRSTIRGFEATSSERFPNDVDLGAENFLLKTEASFFLLKSELRFPIYGQFGGAIFYDGGSVYVKGIDFKDNYRDAIGFAFRYATPVGPFNIEFGYKLDRQDRGTPPNVTHEDPYRIHISIGTF